MAQKDQHEAQVEILDDVEQVTREELAALCGVDVNWIDEMIAHGVIAPAQLHTLHFSAVTITTIRRARRLEQDFALNVPGVALALDLLDEIERLRAEVKRRG
jgi:chaperone modulatory protein CbpM